MHYPGGKAKTFAHIVNLLPKHHVYIEPFLGMASVLRAKHPAPVEYGVDLDNRVLENSRLQHRGVRLIQGDGIEFLKHYPFQGREVVYCDPPYLPSTRRRRRIYRYDATQADHCRLLDIVTSINANVVISGYASPLYADALSGWQLRTFASKAHDGLREESLWFNFEQPHQLHDYRYLGSNFRERQTVKRRMQRLKERIRALTPQERSCLQEWLTSEEWLCK